VKIRMRKLADVAARETLVARRSVSGAENSLGKPKGETLLANAARALKEHTAGQGAGRNALRQSLANVFVAVDVDDWHAEISPRNREQPVMIGGTFSDL
jgi:hypothetical protein